MTEEPTPHGSDTPPVYEGPTPPLNPVPGQIWVDTSIQGQPAEESPTPTPAPTPAQPTVQTPGITIRGRRYSLPWIIGGVAAVLLLLSCGCCGSLALAGALAPKGTTASATNTVVTQAPATATATHAPTATVKPLTRQQIAQDIITKAIASSDDANQIKTWKVTSDDATKYFAVDITLTDQFDIGLAQFNMQTLAYSIFRGLYQSGRVSINDVDIVFQGPVVDQYGKTSTGEYGYCDLTYPTAQKFVWDNLTVEDAWNAYDAQNMRQK